VAGRQNADIADNLQLRDFAMTTIFGRPFVKRIAVCYQTVVCLSWLSLCPVLSALSVTLVYCDQTVGWINMKLGMQIGLGPDHIVLDRNRAPSLKRGRSPQFSANVYCGQMAGWIKMQLDREVSLSPSGIVLDGDPAHPPQKGAESPPQFSAHVCCSQTAGWIKMALGIRRWALVQATLR